MRLIHSVVLVLPMGWLALLSSGCATTSIPVYADINRVSTFYNTQRVWLNFDDPPTDVPEGLKFTLFLSSADSDMGVFGDGTIRIEMFRVDREQGGQSKRTLQREWSFDTQQAFPYRSKKRTRYGWGYGFRIPWGDADVLGHEILISVSFERPDGTVIHSKPKYLKVPKRVFPHNA